LSFCHHYNYDNKHQLHHHYQLRSESPFIFKDQCGSVAVPVEQPVHVYFTDDEKVSQRDEEDDLQTETVEEKLKTGTDEGSSVSKDEGTCRSLWQTS